VIVIETDRISVPGIPINRSQLKAAEIAAEKIGLERIIFVPLDGARDGLDISVACSGCRPEYERFATELWKIQAEFKKEQPAQV